MGIGETLAGARRQAGLTVRQVSHRARLKETIIRSIEDDDYTISGEESHARAHIRAIALAVGLDPRPLIRKYDAARQYEKARQQEAARRQYKAQQRNRAQERHHEPPASARSPRRMPAKEPAAAHVIQPPIPPDAHEERPAERRPLERRRIRQSAMLAVVVLAVLGFASYELVSTVDHAPRPGQPAVTMRPAR